MIYLDNASTTKIDGRVLDAMMPYLTSCYGNAGTLYGIGREAAEAVQKAREQVANFIGAKPDQIIFTSGGSEANSLVFYGVKDYLIRKGKTHIITTQIEHDSVLNAVKSLCREDSSCIKPQFYSTFIAPRPSGDVYVGDVDTNINENTGIVSVMRTNNETGVDNPVRAIAKLCKDKGVLFHTDYVQAAGVDKIDVNNIGCDFLSLSSHKIHGPKGVGALYVRDKSVMNSIIFGGAEQEFGLRGGTENVAGIVGFGEACELSKYDFYSDSVIPSLMTVFVTYLKRCLKEKGIEDIFHVNGTVKYPFIKTINIRFDGVDGETLIQALDLDGVCVSAGSACNSHESTPSHVLTAMGIDDEDAMNSIRISLSRMNTVEEMIDAAEKIVKNIVMLRGMQK